MADKSLIDETIRLLLSALAPSAQSTYLRCWMFWSRYFEARNISQCVNPSEKDWDVDILNYLTWGYSAMKIGGSGLGARCSAIKSLHSMEGRGNLIIKRTGPTH